MVLCLALVLVGVAAAALGAWVEAHPDDRTPLALTASRGVVLPERPLLAAPLVLYGVPGGGARPGVDALACQVTDQDGTRPVGEAPTGQVDVLDRLVVDGRGVVPLLVVSGPAGAELSCPSGAAQQAEPLYLLPGSSARSVVPLAAYTTAAVTLPFGLALLVLHRLTRD